MKSAPKANRRDAAWLIRRRAKKRTGKESSEAVIEAVELRISVMEITRSAQRTVSKRDVGLDEASVKTLRRTSSTPIKAKTDT